ncbi:hypothetical protein J2045_001936 [Peteryoungia aggregata LMG 23059]|uniref:TniQ domain-containing protein n=1 Tax=Peteryoungia aggregata LMG 23059 TaxID=1368425 RepID=A0ABU0G7I1_9HYPH|nr:TniQ family protein [Peteryoungia aggregata]MDQ0420909.1 hypothetical protein [Peteryoungia aggregata LMG 23059]
MTYYDDESLKSFVSRLASSNFFSSIREFEKLTNFSRYGAVMGDTTALDQLADMAGVNRRLVQDRAAGYSRLGDGTQLSGNTFGRARYCPCCISDDLHNGKGRLESRPYVRTLWELSFIRSCAAHGVLLRSLTNHGQDPWDYSNRLQRERSEPQFSEAAVAVEHSAFELYAAERLWGRSEPGRWLDELPFYVAGQLCEWVGAIILFGREFKSNDLDELEWHRAAATGYEIVIEGRDAFVDFLKSLHGIFFEGKHHCGTRKVYGRLYERLAREQEDSSFDVVREIVADTAVNHLPFGHSYELFGLQVRRKLHSLYTLSRSTSMHETTLRKLLQGAGWLAQDVTQLSAHRIIFDADEATRFVKEIQEHLKPAEARSYLDVTRTLWDTLLQENLIAKRALIDDGARKLTPLYLRADLDQLLERLHAGARAPNDDCTARVTIPVAIKKANCSFCEILRLLLDGKLRNATVDPGAAGIGAILIDVAEVRELTRLGDHGGLGVAEASEKLELRPKVLEQLTKAGFLNAEVAVNPVNRCPQTIYRQGELDRFSDEFVSLFGYAARLGVHFKKAKKDLESAGVPVAISTDAVSATFYRWKDIRAAGPRFAKLGVAFAFQ